MDSVLRDIIWPSIISKTQRKLPSFDAKSPLAVDWNYVMTMMKVRMNSSWKHAAYEHFEFATLQLAFWDQHKFGNYGGWINPHEYVLQQYKENCCAFGTDLIVGFLVSNHILWAPLGQMNVEDLALLHSSLYHPRTADLRFNPGVNKAEVAKLLPDAWLTPPNQ